MLVTGDFDGTCVMHEFLMLGRDVPHSVTELRQVAARDVGIILFTIRSGDRLQMAL